MAYCSRSIGAGLPDYETFETFASREFRRFWSSFLAWSAPRIEGSAEPVCDGDDIEHATFFPGLALNYAENLLAGNDERPAVISCRTGRPTVRLTRGTLRERVQHAAGALAALGVSAGDVVALIAYNDAEAVIATLAAAMIGAAIASAAPEMGAPALLSRFGQLAPVLLLAHTETRPGNDLGGTVAAVCAALPSLRGLVALGDGAAPPEVGVPVHRLADLLGQAEPVREWRRFPFNHPLYIMFSSGTTGAPKCIVHGAGGTLIEHLKEHRLHTDLRPGERMFFQTSCAWMMWNWQLSALASNVTIVLYDGAVDGPATLWRIAAEHEVAVFGTSPAYLKLCESSGYRPADELSLGRLRAVLSTGSILYDAQFDWVLRNVKRVPVQSISGGTDIIGCFVLGNPILPVWRGEAQCRSLGMDVAAADAGPDGIGELVCRNPFPSRPVGFFGDADGRRFHKAYFSQNPGLWTHGDRIALTQRGTARLHGRSDGTLSVRGIRVGSAEIYAALQGIPELRETMAVEQQLPDTPAGGRIVLLVVLAPQTVLTAELALRLRCAIARHTTAAHVPGAIIDVPELPTTHSGKQSEAAARDAVNGRPVPNREALRNPGCLDAIARHPGLHRIGLAEAGKGSALDTIGKLRAIWADAFSLDDIGPDDDFFALGGNSLVAVQICAGITTVFGYEMPIAQLLQSSTIRALAEAIDTGLVAHAGSPMVRLKDGAGRPIYLLHSVSGSVFEWHPLVARLDLGRAIDGIQARGLDPAEQQPERVQEMAADYLALIRTRQPEGPYTLLGYSFGGLLAYEIAVRLVRMGEAVDLLGLIDTDVSPNALPPIEWLRHAGQRMAALGAGATLRRVWSRLRPAAGEQGAMPEDLREGAGIDFPPILRRVRAACERAFMDYDPPPAPMEVTFFRSPERRPAKCDPLIVWRRCAASLRVVEVPGTHRTMMMEPDVAVLAAQIAARTDGAKS